LDVQKPIQIKPHIFESVRFGFFKNTHPNRTEPHMIFILDRLTFCLKTDPNRTTNTPTFWSLPLGLIKNIKCDTHVVLALALETIRDQSDTK